MQLLNLEKQKTIHKIQQLSEFLNKGESPLDYEKQLLKDHSKRISEIFRGKLIPPYELEIQPSSLCNLKCKHCFGKALSSNNLKNKITKKELNILAKKINEFKEENFSIEVVKFCGTTGEPLVNPSTMYGITLFKSLGKKIILFTNGLFLDRKLDGREYIDYILEADKINLSIDAGCEKTFKELKGKTGFKRIIKNIRKLVYKRNSLDKKLKIIISFVIGEINHKDILRITQISKDIGVDELIFRVDFTNPQRISELSEKIIKDVKEAKKFENPSFKVISVYSEENIRGDNSGFNSYGRKCFNCYFWACIGPDCNLYACGHRTYSGVKSYGNLLNKSFKQIWKSKLRKRNITCLPDDNCKFCSPSSTRRNDFMTFLYNSLN